MMGIKEIAEYLPHRYPFLLVDRVVSVVPGETIKGFKNVSVNEMFFNGHFPGNPVMPGVLIVEAMAQLSGILAFKTKNRRPVDAMYYLGGVDHARFKRLVVPGDRLDMESKIIADKRNVMKFACNAYVEGDLACEAEVICVEKEV
ncbi:MAG TPA: 3-hydroxyacyl-ACP dehydratase FabZ [Pseudomonadales bacterium]|jgi:3-hydroxyacyl-[acyl-carrier-protein] dehydratase|nr:3-hydroxyacyl-ACP dehydratase FabZ [Pseudomonadales bacterium]